MKAPFSELEHPRDIIRGFIPSWFAVNMGTGITGIVIANFPFPFRGMVTIGSIFFLANVCMFSLFTLLFVARMVFFPETIPLLLKHHQSLMLSTIPMGLTTITNYTILVLVPSHSWALELA
ncbi:Plasma membrane sulfite pump involved in sulfite metabolism, partial [Basidiobolus ranarum]